MSAAAPAVGEPLCSHQSGDSILPLRERALGFLLLVVLVVLAVIRSEVGTRLDGFTVDEPWHIVAGAEYLRRGDFRLNPEHPPLVKLVAGAAVPTTFRMPPPVQLSEKTQERDHVESVMFLQNEGSALQPRVRAVMWFFHGSLLLILGLLIWYGMGLLWAAGTLLFLAIDPTVAAHLPLVMTDLPVALTLMISAVAAGIMASEWRWRWAVLTGVALGLALGSKHSALPGVAGVMLILLVAAIVGGRSPETGNRSVRLLQVVAAGLLAVLVLWGQYGFQFHAGPDGSDAFNRDIAAKIDDVQSPRMQLPLEIADRMRLLPRAYLWGLSDTIRAGVEGRGAALHFIWGKQHYGRPPLHTWPSFIVSKVPLASLVIVLLGAVLLFRGDLSRRARWILFAIGGMSALHSAALLTSRATYAGVRHALPLIGAMAILAGAALAMARAGRQRTAIVVVALLFVASFAMTIREPRVYEYHNELAGGTENGYRFFSNEGVDLGQRFPELRSYYERVIRPAGEPVYFSYWLIEEEVQAAKVEYSRRVQNIHDTNVEGVYEGFFVYRMRDTLPWPMFDWDPAVVFAEADMVARFGNAAVFRGRQVVPRVRAWSLNEAVLEYIYEQNGDDWAVVAQRLEEVAALMPESVGAAVELTNAYVRMGDGQAAIRSMRRVLDQTKLPVDDLVRRQLESRIAEIESGADLRKLPPLRNPWME